MTAGQRTRYPGPPPFADTPEDRLIFFGRDEEARAVAGSVLANRLLVLFGKSGLGKSSLLNAHVFPALRERNHLPIPVRLSQGTPPVDLVVSAARAAAARSGGELVEGERGSLWEFFKTALFWRGDALQTPVLVIDQFEEIFTRLDAAARRALAEELGPLVSGYMPEVVRARRRTSPVEQLSDVAPRVALLLSMREEYLGELEELSAAIPRLFQERFRLLPLDRANATSAIRRPALLGSPQEKPEAAALLAGEPFTYRDDAVDLLLGFLEGRSGVIEPWELQILCRHVEEHVVPAVRARRRDGPVEISAADLGGPEAMERVLARSYETAMAALPWLQQRRAQALCERGLLTPSGYRVPLQQSQIESEYGVTVETLEALVRERILRQEPRLESVFYELSHDTLAQTIHQRRRWHLSPKWRVAARVLAVAFLAAVVGSALYVRSIRQAQKRADDARNAAVASGAAADQARAQAEKVVGFLLGDEFLEPIRETARLATSERVRGEVDRYVRSASGAEPRATTRRIQALGWVNDARDLYLTGDLEEARQRCARAVEWLRQLRAQDPSSLDLMRDLAAALGVLDDILTEEYRVSDAVALSREVVELRTALAARAPDDVRAELDLARSHVSHGVDLKTLGHVAEAGREFAAAIEAAEGRPASEGQQQVDWLRLLAEAYDGLGSVVLAKGHDPAAVEAWQKARGHAEEMVRRSPLAPRAVYQRVIAMASIGSVQSWEVWTSFDQSRSAYEAAEREMASLTQWEPRNARWRRDALVLQQLHGQLYLRHAEPARAKALFDASRRGLEALVVRDPANASWQDDLAAAEEQAASVAQAEGHLEDALRHQRAAVRSCEQLLQIDPANERALGRLASAQSTLADLMVRVGDTSGAREIRERLVVVLARREPDEADAAAAWRLMNAQLALARLVGEPEQRDRALSLCDAAREIAARVTRTCPREPVAWQNRAHAELLAGRVEKQLGRRADAARSLARARDAAQRAVRLDPRSALTWNLLHVIHWDEADLRAEAGDRAAAIGLLDRGQTALDRAIALSPNDPDLRGNAAGLLSKRGRILQDDNRAAEALTALQAAVSARRAAGRSDSASDLNELHRDLVYSARLVMEGGDPAGAIALFRESIPPLERAVELDGGAEIYRANLAAVHLELAEVLEGQHDLEGAEHEALAAEAVARAQVRMGASAAGWCNRCRAMARCASIRQERGDIEGALEARRAAIGAMGKAVRLAPANVTYRAELADAHLALARLARDALDREQTLAAYADAERVARGALAIDARSAPRWNALGNVWFERAGVLEDRRGREKAYQQSLSAYRKAGALAPEDVVIRENTGRAWLGLGQVAAADSDEARAVDRLEDAIRTFDGAIAISPRRTDAHAFRADASWQLAQVLYGSGERERGHGAAVEAIEAGRKAVALSGDGEPHALILVNRLLDLGEVELDEGSPEAAARLEEACDRAEAGVRARPDDRGRRLSLARCRRDLARLHAASGHASGAQEHAAAAVAILRELDGAEALSQEWKDILEEVEQLAR